MKQNFLNSTKRLKQDFVDYFSSKGYSYQTNQSIVPSDKHNLLFVNAGIVTMIDNIEGLEQGKMISIQGCLRLSGKHNDLNSIGESYSHHTYFEMAGHFVWGEKNLIFTLRDAIEFLNTQGLSSEQLFLTYHPDHQWIKENKTSIPHCDWREDSSNEWSAGEYGYHGYCVEIYLKSQYNAKNFDLEIWNCVYVDRYVTQEGVVKSLKQPYLDSGLGLSRLESIINKTYNSYLNLDMKLIVNLVTSFFPKLSPVLRKIVADHFKSIFYIFQEKVTLGHNERGYILKKLIQARKYLKIVKSKN